MLYSVTEPSFLTDIQRRKKKYEITFFYNLIIFFSSTHRASLATNRSEVNSLYKLACKTQMILSFFSGSLSAVKL